MDPEMMQFVVTVTGLGLIGTVAIIASVIYTTRLKIKNGYPLSGAWGQAVYPRSTSEDGERIKLLSQENAQLRAELGSIKDRLANVERIVTDSGYQLTHQIDALRISGKDVQ